MSAGWRENPKEKRERDNFLGPSNPAGSTKKLEKSLDSNDIRRI